MYLIDKSSSMLWVFDELKGIVKKAIDQRGPEDSICIIVFGDSVTTLASYKHLDDSNKAALSGLLDSVYADALYTNLELAIDRGIQHLHTYFCDHMAENYTLVLITDGKNHPPPGHIRERSLEEAVTQFSDFLPGKQWSLGYVVLEGRLDPELLTLLGKYEGRILDVDEIAQTSEATGDEVLASIIEHPEDWISFEAVLVDHTGEVNVRGPEGDRWVAIPKGATPELLAGDSVAVSAGSKAVISFGSLGRVGLEGTTEINLNRLKKMPLEQSSVIQLRLENGTLWNTVKGPMAGEVTYEVLTPIALTGVRGTVFRISLDSQTLEQTIAVLEGTVETSSSEERPSFESFTLTDGNFSIFSSGAKPSSPLPIPKDMILQWERWRKALQKKEPLSHINFQTVLITPAEGKLVMGPIKPGMKFSKMVPLTLSEEYRGKAPISAKVVIDLPPGANIKVDVIDKDDSKLEKNLSVNLQCQPFLRYAGAKEYNGKIRLMCSSDDVRFTEPEVELQILHSPPRFGLWGGDYSTLTKNLILAAAVLSTLFIIFVIWKKRDAFLKLKKWERRVIDYIRQKVIKTKFIHLFRARPTGQLVLRGSSPDGHRKLFNLAEISLHSNEVVLGIGSDPSNAISLSHSSVRPFHCTIWAGRRRNPTRVYINALAGGHLAVNGDQIAHTQEVKDKDVIAIGDYEFEFVDTQLYRQVEVHMNNGTVYESTLEYWDLNHSVFYIRQTLQDHDCTLAVPFMDVSHIHFYQDESARDIGVLPHPLRAYRAKRKSLAKVTLRSGQKLKGFKYGKYRHEDSPGIFLLPPSSEESRIQYTYIPKTSIETFVIVDSYRAH